MKKPDLHTVIIGAGNIAHSLVPALKAAGIAPKLIISRSLDSAKQLASREGIPFYSSDLRDIHKDNSLLILAVPDSQILQVAKELTNLKVDFSTLYCVHLSGSEDLRALTPLEKQGAHTGSLHILQTFPDKRPVPLQNVFAGFEAADVKIRSTISRLGEALELRIFEVSPKQKAFYHLAGVFASNFLVANMHQAAGGMKQAGVKTQVPQQMLEGLVRTTVNNIMRNGVKHSLSGPVARGDKKTVEKHIRAMKKSLKKKEDGWSAEHTRLAAYLAESLSLIDLVEQRDDTISKDLKKIRKLLLKELQAVTELGQ